MVVRRVVLAAAVVLVVAACSSDDGGGAANAGAGATTAAPATTAAAATTVAPTTSALPTTTALAPGAKYYVSLGDSYASGYEANEGNTTNGFAYQVEDLAADRSTPLSLVNFGCAGATTTSILDVDGCPLDALGPGVARYEGMTQIEAAEAFLEEHPGEVGLITVSIGGNDVTKCGDATDAVACVADAVGSIAENVPVLAQRLRAAAGDDVLIVGTTYPDVILGDWVNGEPGGQDQARLSVTAFKDFINPTLQKAYDSAGATFVDVTAATGAYGPLEETTDLAPYGVIPVPVAQVCELTYFCSDQDIHANADGYKVIAQMVVDAYTLAGA